MQPGSETEQDVERWLANWSPDQHSPSAAAAAYAVAVELDHQADVLWNVDGNPDPERLLGRQLPLSAKAFLLDPEFLPRMANSARYMSAALEQNDH